MDIKAYFKNYINKPAGGPLPGEPPKTTEPIGRH